MMNSDLEPARVAAESPPGSDSRDHSSEFVVHRVCPTKRAGAILANSWVQIGEVRIRFKILNGPYGPFVAAPATSYKSSSGRTCYARHVWLEPDLHQQISEAVLEAYELRLAEDGRRVPQPFNQQSAPDRVQSALMAASEMIDRQRAGECLLSRINDVLDDAAAEPIEQWRAVRLLMQLLDLDTKRLCASLDAVNMASGMETTESGLEQPGG